MPAAPSITDQHHPRPIAEASLWVIIAVSCLLILAIDITTPRGVAGWIGYVIPILFSRWHRNLKAPFILAAICSIFIVVGYLVEPHGNFQVWVAITNRAIGIVVLWLVAALIYISRRAEQELRQADAQSATLAAIVASAEDAIISKTLDGIITSWNKGAEHLFGFSASEMIGRHINALIPETLRTEEKRIINEVRHGKTIYAFESARLRKDGTPIAVSLTVSPIYDHTMRIVGASNIARDITERKRAEERFRLAVEASPNGIIITNREGFIVLVNAQAEKMFGYRREELVGKPVELLVPERLRHEHSHNRAAFFAMPNARAMGKGRDLHARRKDGSEFPMEIGLNPIETEEGLMVFGAIIDITERKQIEEKDRQFHKILEQQVAERTEQLATANRELEEFAYVASHDLKAPLRVIDNASKWLEEDLEQYLTDDTRDSMNLLRGRVQRMEKLLDDLLEYSRIGRKIDNEYSETVTGDALIDNIQTLLSPPPGFRISVSPAFASLKLPRMPLQQILLNLIGNAIKHHDRANGAIDITVEDAGQHYIFAVKDDGPGIPEQYHEQVFKMFQTLKPRDQVEGSGMGLANVRKYLQAFGGAIHLESEGRGCTFRFTWPKTHKPLEAAA